MVRSRSSSSHWAAAAAAALLLTASGCNTIGIPRTIYLARHGQTEWNRIGRFQGDPDLDPVGYLNRVSLWMLLKDRPLAAIYTSERLRTRRTAALLARQHELPIHQRAELNEIDPGVLEGICIAHDPDHAGNEDARACLVSARGSRPQVVVPTVRALIKQIYGGPPSARPPLGESFLDTIAKTRRFVSELDRRYASSEILIVGHGVVNRALLHHFLGWSLAQTRHLRIENDQVFRIQGAGTELPRAALYTPGVGWRLCSAPKAGQRYLDCHPGPAKHTGPSEVDHPPAAPPASAPATPEPRSGKDAN